jgi:PUB domain
VSADNRDDDEIHTMPVPTDQIIAQLGNVYDMLKEAIAKYDVMVAEDAKVAEAQQYLESSGAFSFADEKTEPPAKPAPAPKKVESIFDQKEPMTEEEMRPATPPYNVSDIRRALKREHFAELNDDAYLKLVSTLLKMTQNLLKPNGKAAYRNLDLSNANFHQRIGKWSGCMQYFAFLGFRTIENRLVLSPEDEDSRVAAAEVILRRMHKELDVEKHIIPDRNIRVFLADTKNGTDRRKDNNIPTVPSAAVASTTDSAVEVVHANANTDANDADTEMSDADTTSTTAAATAASATVADGSTSSTVATEIEDATAATTVDTVRATADARRRAPEPEEDEDRGHDMTLLMQAWKQSQREHQMRSQFVFRDTIEKERQSRLPKYQRTMIDVLVEGDNVIVRMDFHPEEKLEELFNVLNTHVLCEPYASDNNSYVLRVPPITVIRHKNSAGTTFRKESMVPAATVILRPTSGDESKDIVRQDVIATAIEYKREALPSSDRPKSSGDGGADSDSKKNNDDKKTKSSKAAAANPFAEFDDDMEMDAIAEAMMSGKSLKKAMGKKKNGSKKSKKVGRNARGKVDLRALAMGRNRKP